MGTFHHKNQNQVLRLLGGLLLLIGLIALVTPVFLEVDTPFSKVLMASAVPLVFGLFLISTYSGTLLDFETNRSKAYQCVLWFRFGDWENLPKIEHAELIHHSYFRRNTPNGISPTLGGEVTVYKCVLVAEGQNSWFLTIRKNLKPAPPWKNSGLGSGFLEASERSAGKIPHSL